LQICLRSSKALCLHFQLHVHSGVALVNQAWLCVLSTIPQTMLFLIIDLHHLHDPKCPACSCSPCSSYLPLLSQFYLISLFPLRPPHTLTLCTLRITARTWDSQPIIMIRPVVSQLPSNTMIVLKIRHNSLFLHHHI
jgi:hypothetical protein